MEVGNFDDPLTQETMAFVDKIKTRYEDKLAEKDAEIEKLKNELEERKDRCCPKGYEKDTDIMIVDTSAGDSVYAKYKHTHAKDFDKMLAFVRRDKRSYEIYERETMRPKKYHVIYSKKGLPVSKTLFNYIKNNLAKKYTVFQLDCYHNRIFLKKDIFEEAVEEIKNLIENFQEKE